MEAISDTPTTLLIFFNVVQVVIILVLLLPFIDIVTLSKNIKDFTDSARNNPITATLLFSYGFILVIYGILSPSKTLTELKHSNIASEGESPEDILRRIVACSNASRNYILGAFSLFFLLVIIRLFDYVNFSAKLHEFSELMANYDLVDITLISEPAYDSNITFIIDEPIEEEDETVPWPVTSDFNKEERSQIRKFLRDTPKKLSVLANKATCDYDKNKKYGNKKNTAVADKRSIKTADIFNTDSELIEIVPKSSERERTEEKDDIEKKEQNIPSK